MDWIFTVEGWIALITLTALEIVLGIDNIVFLSILAGKLQVAEQGRDRSTRLNSSHIQKSRMPSSA